ncbi:hypothetical protein L226DRAFT_571741 [Lentinus tigrinus ALCF2SS1-7]|uniref:uncharacterized protein n=1 Tax=Lentinus tigrinus ALCF2SS1-7 TaxID=1328758 RepID=UPI001165D2E1|nr:hypothetical protein L226DRAFT_571741 [Lentinus tigrinus ALCF2SS1-7]
MFILLCWLLLLKTKGANAPVGLCAPVQTVVAIVIKYLLGHDLLQTQKARTTRIQELKETIAAQSNTLATTAVEIGRLQEHMARDKLLRELALAKAKKFEQQMANVKTAQLVSPPPLTPANVDSLFIQAIPANKLASHPAYQNIQLMNQGLSLRVNSLRAQCEHLTKENAQIAAAHTHLTYFNTKLKSEVAELTMSGERQTEEYAKLARDRGVEDVMAENASLKIAVAAHRMELERCRANERGARENADQLQATNGRLVMDNYTLQGELTSARSSRR